MLQDIITEQKALFADGVHTVVRGHENRIRRVSLLKGSLVGNVRSETRGVSARVCRGGVYGFASAAGYTPEDVKTVLKAASDNAAFLDLHAGKHLPPFPSAGGGVIPVMHPITDTPQAEIIEACRTVDAYIESHYPDLKSRSVTYYEDSQDKIICTSDAWDGHVTYPRCYLYITLSAESEQGTPVELFRALGGLGSFRERFSDLSWIYPEIETLYRNLMNKREGVYAQAGMKTVVIDGMLGGMLAHEAVGHTVEADLVLGGSVAGPNLNRRVASDLISLVDYAHTAFGETAPLPVYLDDEGTKAEDAVLIRDGILTGYMNSRETAAHFGVSPAGNARAWDFSDEPLIRMRNTCILPGKDKLEDMIASVDDGYYLIETGNGQADLTGEFMFGINMGYEIKKGKLGKAILDTTVTGIAFDMLKTADMVSDSVVWSSSGFCGKKQRMPVGMGGPAIRCRLMIGGR